jgi:hypothetical protein
MSTQLTQRLVDAAADAIEANAELLTSRIRRSATATMDST